jgi:orotidine-5'-phosphate decarboxylase
MTRQELISAIREKGSFLCVGLDTDLTRIPASFRNSKYPIFEFNKAIIDATKDHCVAYKPNIAFYEAYGAEGWVQLEMTAEYIPDTHLAIADAKRGDIGNTSKRYAEAFFHRMDFDAITVAPYMGEDSIRPFLEFDDKWVIVLGLTSNKGSRDFQHLHVGNRRLFEEVIEKTASWAGPDQLMFVAGATQADELGIIRSIIPDHFLLVPGVGAQGGDLQEVAQNGSNKDIGLLVNSTRQIIYASNGEDFMEAAGKEAAAMHNEMRTFVSSQL